MKTVIFHNECINIEADKHPELNLNNANPIPSTNKSIKLS